MKTYEIVNPSDHVLVTADDELVACIAVLILGHGKFGLKDTDGNTVMPLFLFGGADEWLVERGVDDLSAWLTKHKAQLAAVYDSAFYGTPTELRALEVALADLPREKQLAARRKYNDEKRSSLNDIGGACAAWAERCRA